MKTLVHIFTVLSLSVSISPALALETKGFSPDKQIVYKTVGETELKLHVFNPADHKTTDARPVAVFFFGGGWVSGSPSQFYPHCEYLASRGIVAIAAEYRIKSKHKTTPQECVKDGKSAIRWVRQHASELGIDPNKVIAGGGSAGGHVAAATATTKAFNEEGEDTSVSCVPDALVLFNPVFDNGPVGGWSTCQGERVLARHLTGAQYQCHDPSHDRVSRHQRQADSCRNG